MLWSQCSYHPTTKLARLDDGGARDIASAVFIKVTIEFSLLIMGMPQGTNHQVLGPCGIIDLFVGMLLVTLKDLDQRQRVLEVLQWCEDVDAS
jgi:hypothetical protein